MKRKRKHTISQILKATNAQEKQKNETAAQQRATDCSNYF
jgi:hypothetical protein